MAFQSSPVVYNKIYLASFVKEKHSFGRRRTVVPPLENGPENGETGRINRFFFRLSGRRPGPLRRRFCFRRGDIPRGRSMRRGTGGGRGSNHFFVFSAPILV